MLEDYATQPAPGSRSISLAGSVAIHVALLVVVFQLRSSVEAHMARYTATTLYTPAVESVPVAARKVRPAPVLHHVLPPVLPAVLPAIPPAFVAKLKALKPVPDLPAPPELPVTRKTPLPSARPVMPAPTLPTPAAPVFASVLPVTPSMPRSVAPRTGAFGSVPVTTAPATAKLQVVGDTFRTVPAETPRSGPAAGGVLPSGFGTAGVTAANPHRGPSVTPSNGFGGVAAATPSQELPPKPEFTPTTFAAAVAADPVRHPVANRQPTGEPLEILFKPRPDYTEEARRARVEGDVLLEVLFTASGNLRVQRVVRGLGHGLDQNAIDAAAKIRFRPATEDGRAVDTVATVRISFQIAY